MHALFAKSMLLVSSRSTYSQEQPISALPPELHLAHICYADISDNACMMREPFLNWLSTKIGQMTIKGDQQSSLGWTAHKVRLGLKGAKIHGKAFP